MLLWPGGDVGLDEPPSSVAGAGPRTLLLYAGLAVGFSVADGARRDGVGYSLVPGVLLAFGTVYGPILARCSCGMSIGFLVETRGR
jgi:hypothetical protein